MVSYKKVSKVRLSNKVLLYKRVLLYSYDYKTCNFYHLKSLTPIYYADYFSIRLEGSGQVCLSIWWLLDLRDIATKLTEKLLMHA